MNYLKEIARNPQIDWILLIFITLIAVVGLAVSGFSLYNAVTSGQIQGKPTKPSGFIVDEKTIGSVIDLFSKRKEVSDKARAGYTGAPDPSV